MTDEIYIVDKSSGKSSAKKDNTSKTFSYLFLKRETTYLSETSRGPYNTYK